MKKEKKRTYAEIVEELEIIAEKLDIDLDERKWKKQDLYNEITKLTKWY